jgi:hypothetical protein
MQHGLCESTLDGWRRRTILSEVPMTARARFLTAMFAAALCACGSGSGSDADAAATSPSAVSGQDAQQGMLQGESAGNEGGESGGNAEGPLPTGRPGGIGRSGGQTGGEAGIRCSPDVELQPLAFDAASPLGYSAADILAGLRSSYAATFSYADDSTSALTVTLASDGGRAAYAPGCSRNEIDVAVGWSSADGAFAETLRGKLFALSPDAATLDVELPLQELAGSYARSHAAELTPQPVSFSFQLEFEPSEAHGNVSALRGAPDAQDSLAIGSY